jgi:hypothetical protein
MPPAWLQAKMVLPVRIELTTSALPRMRSTTELRQHIRGERGAYGREAAKLSRKRRMKGPEKDPKAERLAAALRDNLKRRKAQARSAAAANKPKAD